MITLPIWLIIIIGIFGFPLIVVLIALLIMYIKAIIIIVNEIIKTIKEIINE